MSQMKFLRIGTTLVNPRQISYILPQVTLRKKWYANFHVGSNIHGYTSIGAVATLSFDNELKTDTELINEVEKYLTDEKNYLTVP